MFKFKPLRSILIWLSIIGKDHLTALHDRKSQFIPILLHAFRAISLVFLITTLFYPFKDGVGNGSLSVYAVNYLSFNIVIVNSVDIVASWLHTNSASSIVAEIEESLDALNAFTNLNARIEWFVRGFRRKFFFAFFLFAVECIIRLIFPSEVLKTYTYVIVTVAVFYKSIAIFYVTFFIDVQTFILLSLNENLNTMAIDYANDNLVHAVSETEEKIHILRRTQIIYLHVYKISENINARFGGFLLSICIGTVIILIYGGTSTFDILMKQCDKSNVLREWFYSYCIFNAPSLAIRRSMP